MVLGTRTLASTCRGLAAYDCISSICVGLLCRRPLVTWTKTMKKTAMLTMSRRPIWLSRAYMLLSTPTITTAGTAATVTASGLTRSATRRNRLVSTEPTNPRIAPSDQAHQGVDTRDDAGLGDQAGIVEQRLDDRRRLRDDVRLHVLDLHPRLPQPDEDHSEDDGRNHDRQTFPRARCRAGHRSSTPTTASPTWVPRNASRTSVILSKNSVASRVSSDRSRPMPTSTIAVMRPGRGDMTTTRSAR